jgi:hypothetical protein
MALVGNGNLLIRTNEKTMAKGLMRSRPAGLAGYKLEPLFDPPKTHGLFAKRVPANRWLLARPNAKLAARQQPAAPWDKAHAAAAAGKYAHYVEPDLVHASVSLSGFASGNPAGSVGDGFNEDWPPSGADAKTAPPDWHLRGGYTGFSEVRSLATGTGVRIAHLDTGYTPGHASTPRNILTDLAIDFWQDGKQGAVDPGTKFLGLMPGHGTATLALLAGAKMTLTFNGQSYSGDIGGAPDGQILPVRIGPSVIHLYTSTMAKGLYYALHQNCDVVSLSHGGLPSESWADAVNDCYNAGVVIVAAAGDSFYFKVIDLATRYTVYPSAFNRVITAVGATYDKSPYVTSKFGVMQGCWGPDAVMEKAVAAFTPNVPWMRYDRLPAGFDMDGGGTSASTPQIAAACALWIQLYGKAWAADWQRVEACRLALFDTANNAKPDKAELGWGLLDAKKMLDPKVANGILAKKANLKKSAEDRVSHPIWDLLTGGAPANSAQEQMYETEVVQIVMDSSNPLLRNAAAAMSAGHAATRSESLAIRQQILAEPISKALRARLARVK